MNVLLPLAALFPLALFALSAFSPWVRQRLARLLWLAPLPGLVAALFAIDGAVTLPGPLGLALDFPGAMLLGAAALIWLAAGIAAPAFWREKLETLPYQSWWLLTMTGSLAVFMAANLVTFYLTFSLVSLAGYGLVTRDGGAAAFRAGRVYFTLAVVGEAFLLTAFVLLAVGTPSGSMAIPDVVAALPASPSRDAALVFLILGLGSKMGLVPLHVWMPPTYSAAPFPAAAVLSGAAVKAGVIGLVRFLPFSAALPGWGEALAMVGFVSAFFGVAVGLTQRNPKAVLAYSSISQMGFIAAVAGMALAAGRLAAPSELAFYALHHVFAKGGLFLALAAIATTGPRHLRPILWPAIVVALGIAGLPLTGGALAKLAVKDALGSGLAGTLGSLSAAASTILMLHFITRARTIAASDDRAEAPLAIRGAWWIAAAAALLLPWLLFPSVAGSIGKVLEVKAIFDLAWPMVLGGVAFLGWSRLSRRPELPPGDVLIVLRPAATSVRGLTDRIARAEAWITTWPVAGTLLLLLAIGFAGAMVAAR
ncbi:Formate hydrogenlyase subunit 3/Multisubunit Na+/H+ antiporter, MnhD subunit [Kaistia soli DSM 19436]|uniref:Formate hydrogenlyase subunit 3/Multisubunit Na+/H+ antiporter, MnhD subunit n=1 Tax=Kaistia soli DSM 19436 TaxID=1122133 RepID=A0A1M5GFN4_9HYPH|nr:proton-conducting transporter membrane subunit [Kaistia soli]SHG02509.1 Formate hydrogenlyase subunit 3/Multisubunit Na+/H+ antiporter, MnhD subunit [Kaistia soli DSM 19436]